MAATGLSGLDMLIWFAGGVFEWFGYANLDNINDNRLNYPEGAFSQLFNFCIAPGFWINLMLLVPSYTIFGSFSMLWGSICGLVDGLFFHLFGVLYHEDQISPIRSG